MLLAVHNLRKYFPVRQGFWKKTKGMIHAVDGVSLSLPVQQTVGLVGESGCGKSSLARLILGLLKPDEGEVFYEDKRVSWDQPQQARALRRLMQIVFQDSANAFDPRFTVGGILEEPLILMRVKGQGS